MEIRDDDAPTRVVLLVTNHRNATVSIEAVAPIISAKSLLHDDDFADQVPPEFNYRVPLLVDGKPLADGEAIQVPPDESSKLSPSCNGSFPTTHRPCWQSCKPVSPSHTDAAATLRAEPAAFIMQSQPGALDAVVNATADNGENDRRILSVLDQYTGVPSPGFTAFRDSAETSE